MDRSTDKVGQNIRRIRRLKNITQVELGRLLGMHPGPINNIENSRNLPSARVLCKLATVLDVSIDAFFCDSDTDVGCVVREDSASYLVGYDKKNLRGPHALIARTNSEISAIDETLLHNLSQVVDSVLALEDICGAQKSASLPLNIPFDITEEGLCNLSRQVRQFLGVNEAVVFDYLELLENAGFRIIFSELLANEKSLGCYDSVNCNVFIFIARTLPVEQQLFRIFYEFGRIFLLNLEGMNIHLSTLGHAQAKSAPISERRAEAHRDLGLDYRGKPFTQDRAARRFAALLLMPETPVRKTVSQLGISTHSWSYELLLRIKHRFGISAESFLYRLDELDLIAEENANDYRTKIHQYYAENEYTEPGGTRRILTKNARLGDLLLIAKGSKDVELKEIDKCLKDKKVRG